MYNICPNCLTNEWNDNKNQICIHCKLDLSFINFSQVFTNKEGEVFFAHKKKDRYKNQPKIWKRRPWLMLAQDGDLLCHVLYQHYWDIGACDTNGPFAGWVYVSFDKVNHDYEHNSPCNESITNDVTFAKKYPKYGLHDLIV